ncbi:RES family NAD+ phosphorylase [Gilvibacter sp.]|uniref:RES family NAD+ phosphorylase n=1 Tax=Gilvibacter sp. TaxID=2729997 RepID=UPI003F49C802
MNICANCFSDKELIAFIKAQGSISTCGICGTGDTHTILLDELVDFFQELIDNFTPDETGLSLRNKIQGDWSLFSSRQVAATVLDNVLPKLKTQITHSDFTVNYQEEILDNISYWEELKEELKWNMRFVTNINYLTEELFWDSFFETQYELDNKTTLFRARVHHKNEQSTYLSDEMKSPPREIARGGRVNPPGIPTLYLSDNKKTVLYEVRATYLDDVTIGEFVLDGAESIKIVDFTEDTSLFYIEGLKPIDEIIKGKLLRDKISSDLSKPMRRFDSELEYIPTQFICEFIRVFTGAEGIRFKSSLHPPGNNLVIFNQDLMSCTSTYTERVNKVDLDSIKI